MANTLSSDNVDVLVHSSIRIKATDGTVLYVDPYDLKGGEHDADYIFFTHAHYDHFSPEDISKVNKPDTIYIAPATMKDDLATIHPKTSYLMKPGDQLEMGNISVEAIPAYNVETDRLGFHPKENEWLGYVIALDGVRYYIAGDTDQNADNEKVHCDIALIPIGGTYTMDPKQAATFINTIRPAIVIPTHYGDIVGTMEDADTFASLVDPGISVVRKIGC
ncbi:MAG: MBL fold metallo-hydrolase [Eggerthellaceae bacterium]